MRTSSIITPPPEPLRHLTVQPKQGQQTAMVFVRKGLREDVRHVVVACNVGCAETTTLHKLADEEVASFDVFGASRVDGVLGQGNGALIVAPKKRHGVLGLSKGAQEVGEPHELLSGCGACIQLGFTRGESHRWRAVCAPTDDAGPKVDAEPLT